MTGLTDEAREYLIRLAASLNVPVGDDIPDDDSSSGQRKVTLKAALDKLKDPEDATPGQAKALKALRDQFANVLGRGGDPKHYIDELERVFSQLEQEVRDITSVNALHQRVSELYQGLENVPQKLHKKLQTLWERADLTCSATEWIASAADTALREALEAIGDAEGEIQSNVEAKREFEKLRDVLTQANAYAQLEAQIPAELSSLPVAASNAEKASEYALALQAVRYLQPIVRQFSEEVAGEFGERLARQKKAITSFEGKLSEESMEELEEARQKSEQKLQFLERARTKTVKAVTDAESALVELENAVIAKEDDVEQLETKLQDFGAIEARYKVVVKGWTKRKEDAPPDYQKERKAQEKLEEIDELWSECVEAFKTRDLDELDEALRTYGRNFLDEVRLLGANDEADKAAIKAKEDLEQAQYKPIKDAIEWGGERFTAGTIAEIWEATVKSLKVNGLESIDGEYLVNAAEGLIPEWTQYHAGNSGGGGILSQLHIPGNRPQPKWVDHDNKRDEIQLNFCAYFRNRKTNIHVDVEPNSFFNRYPGPWNVQEIVDRKKIWKRLTPDVKQLLRDNYAGVLSE